MKTNRHSANRQGLVIQIRGAVFVREAMLSANIRVMNGPAQTDSNFTLVSVTDLLRVLLGAPHILNGAMAS